MEAGALQAADAPQLLALAASSDAAPSHIKEEQPVVPAADPGRRQPQQHDTAAQVSAAGGGHDAPADMWVQDSLVSLRKSMSVWLSVCHMITSVAAVLSM